jgi:hypothetical protein
MPDTSIGRFIFYLLPFGVLARRPREISARHKVEVNVLDGLTCTITAVICDTEAIVEALLLGNLSNNLENVSNHTTVFSGNIRCRGDVHLGYYEYV